MEPEEQLQALIKIETRNLELLAIFHSHPTGPPYPSQQDIRLFYYPETVTIILSPVDNDWYIRGFLIKEKGYKEIQIDILSE
jgi:proteasome lid subunit RPN8/RPN11